jgi:crossover junction endodeoxyribonuclease RusA
MTQIALPWPTSALSQNSRFHWRVRASQTKAARLGAHLACLAAGLRNPSWDGARLTFAFSPPDRRRRDASNVIGALKAAVDGISDAIGVDDSRFRIVWPEAFAEPARGGLVRVAIEPLMADSEARK